MQINYIFSCVRALKQSKARKTFFSAHTVRKKNVFNVCVLNNLHGYKTAIASLLRCARHQKVCAFRLRVCCSLILWRVEAMGDGLETERWYIMHSLFMSNFGIYWVF